MCITAADFSDLASDYNSKKINYDEYVKLFKERYTKLKNESHKKAPACYANGESIRNR